MDDRVAELLAAVEAWAAEDPALRAAVLIGSQARAERPADAWSDVDLALCVADPDALAADDAWLRRLGEPELTFVTRTPGGDPERRTLFADGLELDVVLLPWSALDVVRGEPAAQDLLRRGFRVLWSDDGAGIELLPATEPPPTDLVGLATDFRYHVLWCAKKLRRGEALVARDALELHLKPLLLGLARTHAERGGRDTWHADRFAETWADPRARSALWASASAPEELPAVLLAVADAFEALAAELGVAAAPRVHDRLAALLDAAPV